MSRIIRLIVMFSVSLLIACCSAPESKVDLQMEENKALVQRYIEEMDNHNWLIFSELFAKDFVAHWPGGIDVRGPEGVEKTAKNFFIAFPDLKHFIEDIVAEGDKVVVRYTMHGTHEGEFMGIVPTGKQVTFTATVFYRIENGKIIEAWVDNDALGMMQQLGMELKPKEV